VKQGVTGDKGNPLLVFARICAMPTCQKRAHQQELGTPLSSAGSSYRFFIQIYQF